MTNTQSIRYRLTKRKVGFLSPSAFSFPVLSLAALCFAAGCEVPQAEEQAQAPTNEPDAMEPDEMVMLTFCEQHHGASCDLECTSDTGCPQGLHCAEEKCTTTCVTSADCEPGNNCTPRGRCEPEEDGVIVINPEDLPDIDPAGPMQKPMCVEGEVEFEAVVPQVWMLLDRSGSMSSSLSTNTRWASVGNVLLGDPMDAEDRGVVGNFQDRVAFGATFYTSGSSSTGCVLSLETVALARNSYTDIRARYNKLAPSGGTPTAESIAATVAIASSRDLTGGPKILVLATDGAPGACSATTGTATVAVENEVQQAFFQGISTFAISISSDTDAPHMQRVANLGVGLEANADPPAPVYTAESQEDLALAFNTILEDVPRSCVFELNGEVDPEKAGEGTVTLAGNELVYQDPNGWVLKQIDQVELVGAACEQIRAGEEDLDITFPCSVFTPVVR